MFPLLCKISIITTSSPTTVVVVKWFEQSALSWNERYSMARHQPWCSPGVDNTPLIPLWPKSWPKAISPSCTNKTLSQTDCRTKTISAEELKASINSLLEGWNGQSRRRVRLLEAELGSAASTGHEASPLKSETGVRIAIIRGFLKRMDCWTAVLMGPWAGLPAGRRPYQLRNWRKSSVAYLVWEWPVKEACKTPWVWVQESASLH